MLKKIIKSWSGQGKALHASDELLAWIEERNQNLAVNIALNRLSESSFGFMMSKLAEYATKTIASLR